MISYLILHIELYYTLYIIENGQEVHSGLIKKKSRKTKAYKQTNNHAFRKSNTVLHLMFFLIFVSQSILQFRSYNLHNKGNNKWRIMEKKKLMSSAFDLEILQHKTFYLAIWHSI